MSIDQMEVIIDFLRSRVLLRFDILRRNDPTSSFLNRRRGFRLDLCQRPRIDIPRASGKDIERIDVQKKIFGLVVEIPERPCGIVPHDIRLLTSRKSGSRHVSPFEEPDRTEQNHPKKKQRSRAQPADSEGRDPFRLIGDRHNRLIRIGLQRTGASARIHNETRNAIERSAYEILNRPETPARSNIRGRIRRAVAGIAAKSIKKTSEPHFQTTPFLPKSSPKTKITMIPRRIKPLFGIPIDVLSTPLLTAAAPGAFFERSMPSCFGFGF